MDERQQRIKTAVSRLEKLTELRFANPSPDLFTLHDFKVRYPLTQFGPLAIEAMEKSQRISRQQKDYTIIGLCEFHIGLIYLHNEDCMGALQHFNNAQHQWLFVNEPSGSGLSYYAQAEAQHLNWQYEAAMASLNKARRCLPRINLERRSREQNEFIELLTSLINSKYEAVRQDLWRTGRLDEEESRSQAEPDVEDEEVEDEEVEDEEVKRPSDDPGGAPPPPTSSTLEITHEQDEERDDSPPPPPPPHAAAMGPYIIDGHAQVDPSFAWYLVITEPMAGFFPLEIQKGSLLLIDKRTHHGIRGGELVVIGHESSSLLDENAVRVQPMLGISPYPILTLAWLDVSGDDDTLYFRERRVASHLDTSTSLTMRKIPTKANHIVGAVVGSWHPVIIE